MQQDSHGHEQIWKFSAMGIFGGPPPLKKKVFIRVVEFYNLGSNSAANTHTFNVRHS